MGAQFVAAGRLARGGDRSANGEPTTMTRIGALTMCLAAVAGWPAAADDAAKELTPAERTALEAKARALNEEGGRLYQSGRLSESRGRFEAALEVRRRLFPPSGYPDGHPELAASLSNLAAILQVQGQAAAAEPLC